MSETPFISVILPVYNGGKDLARAARSILNQTRADFELIVVDDGSTDGAASALAAMDPRIRMIGSSARRGLSARLNEGVAAAKGRYIARMDADDIAFPKRFEKQAAFLDMHPDIDLVGCRAVVFRGDKLIGLLPFRAGHDEICAQPWRGIPLPHPTWMGRAEWFRRFPYASPEVKRAEDQEILLRSYGTSRFACLNDILLAYRQGDFNFRKTFTARLHLLAAQLRSFTARRQWKNAFLVLAVTKIKILVDLLAAIPGCDDLFFSRMAGEVPAEAAQEFKRAQS